jgi:putative hydrolase of HD superfamily
MSNLKLEDILSFTKLLNKFQEVERVLYVPGTNKLENDAEHSYQLAMLAWYILSNNSFNLNKDLVIKYALIHDLVEVYAGDTFLYSKDQNEHNSKNDREESARLRIKEEFLSFEDLHETISNYENKKDAESNFVYVLDKIHPVIQLYLDNGRMWKEREVTLAMLIEKKKSKAQLSPELLPLWNELEEILTEEQSTIFYNNQKLPM